MGDLRGPNDAVFEDFQPSSSPWWSGQEPLCVGQEKWARAEMVTREIILRVQPTVASERRRRDVIDYVQRLFRDRLGCELLPFGSVPLKTYLPDGDIDLTAFGDFYLEEALAKDVYAVLEAEDHNPAAEFAVKDVQYIQAEVKLVKCLVQNIVVDISFNQIGGLCTLCFLEQVDLRIGKDHLFKRSIILIKAWCYHESRILGSHHGLISTYALEMLVLYIFNLFHASLNGPLVVLYKFLEYYSKFDWENFCVTLNGPIHMSSLQELMAERPENGSGDLLPGNDFFKEFLDMFSVPPRGIEEISKMFTQKHINIVDPLKDNNNLGRSVSKASFFRIRSAIALGARKLGQILSQPEENIEEEVRNFFSNTIDRHGRGQRPDVPDPILGAYFPNGHSYGASHQTVDLDSDELAASASLEDASVSTVSRQSGDEDIWSRPVDVHHNALVDLAGDYESHLSSWQYGRLWYNAARLASSQSNTPSSLFQGKSPPGGHSIQLRQNVFSEVHSDGVIPRPQMFPMNPAMIMGRAAFGTELNTARGTGMYFPIMNRRTYRERSSPVKAHKSHRNNGFTLESPVKSMHNGRSYEPTQVPSSAHRLNGKRLSPSFHDPDPPKEVVNGAKKTDEFGSPVQLSPQPDILDQNSTLVKEDRFAAQLYHLKDEEDFPPLSI